MGASSSLKAPTRYRFRDELTDFMRFVARPSLARRAPGRKLGNHIAADWLSGLGLGRLLKWALFLWAVNLIFLGPIAVAAATALGAEHRLNLHAIPWLQALVWAPVVEELVFRYSLRRIAHGVWVLPLGVGIMLTGPTTASVLFLMAVLLICWSPWADRSRFLSSRRRPGRSWALRRRYRDLFPWVFHTANLAFAAVHLHNFTMTQAALWLLPLLVLPQWLTGMVLGWLRVKRGIGSAMLLHGLFNGGPLLLVWLFLIMAPDMAF